MHPIAILEVRTIAQLRTIKDLFLEYAAGLGVDLRFQAFDRELASLPAKYAPAAGALFLAQSHEDPAGCVGIRPLEADICEMKRLYVRPSYRGTGLGRRLAETAMNAARERNYATMRLDTLASMASAAALYRSLGFVEIDAYYANPVPGALYLEARLKRRA